MTGAGPGGPIDPNRPRGDGRARHARPSRGRHAAPGEPHDPIGDEDPEHRTEPGSAAPPGSPSADPGRGAADPGAPSPDDADPGDLVTAAIPGSGSPSPDDADPGDLVTAGATLGSSTVTAEDATGPLAASRSLSPAERVVPTWTDPTVRRASALIGGPLGRHASVGRARVFTPLRVALLMAIAALICGWLFKSPCIQQGAGGGLDQGGQRPWVTGCYNDVVPLYGGRGLNDPNRDPYSYVWVENRPGGSSGRVYLPSQVHQQDGRFVADDAGQTVTVGEHDLVGDPAAGYSEVSGNRLVPVPADQVGTVRYLEYPVVTGYFMWGVSALTSAYLSFAQSTHLVPVPLDVAAYFTIGAILLGLAYLVVVACTARIARRRIWDTAVMCLSPLLIVHAFTNWDLLAIGFTGGAMLAWARRKPVLAGALLGLGTAAKLYPVFLLGPLLVLCLRSGRMRAWTKALVSAAVVWVGVNLPIMLAYPRAWMEFYTMNSTRGPEWDSWYYLTTVFGRFNPWSDAKGNATPLLNDLSLGLFVAACVAIAWFALSVRRRPRFAQLAFLVIAAFLLTNKVWSPQYSLWLVPLVALALPRWRRVLSWQFAEAVVWMLLMLSFDTDSGKNLSIHPFAAAAVIRDILLIALVVRIVREIIRPELDLIRLAGDDDPSGGVLEGAPDRFTIPSLPALVRRVAGRGRDRAAARTADEGVPEPAAPA